MATGTPPYLLALDQGTTSSRTIVFDAEGRVISVAQQDFEQIYPRGGWVEHDPMELWSSQNATLSEAVSRAGIRRGDIAAIGIANQRETTVVWERATGRPIYNAIVWQDRRTAARCQELRDAGVESMVREKTGLRFDPYFSATKIGWILDEVGGARQRAERGELLFGTVDSWLVYRLTGGKVHCTDVSNASRTLLMNLRTLGWDEELLELFKVPRAMLPEIRSNAEVYGTVAPDLFPGEVPIAGMAGDQQAALFGQACFQPGMAKCTYGTGCFLLLQTGEALKHSGNDLLSTVAWKVGGKTSYALEGSIFVGGALFQWLRDGLGMVRDVGELDRLAASVEDAGGLFVVPAFTGLGAPHWDPEARGLIIGITRGTGRAEICRAAVEAIGFQVADLIAGMEEDSGLDLRELRVDGGAARSEPMLQFQSDLLGREVVRPRVVETTASGAAFLAGIGVGLWSDGEAVAGCWAEDKRFAPGRSRDSMEGVRRDWLRAVERSRHWNLPGESTHSREGGT